MAEFFIKRPVFAWVLAIMVMLAGALSISNLPIAQYPTIAPPTVRITALYPGASAQTIENAVTKVIEQQMTGIDNLLYMSSTSSSEGRVTITLTFRTGTDDDIAQVQTQNKLNSVLTTLPQDVQDQGVTVTKASDSFLMVVALNSKDGAMTNTDIADYISSNIKDPIARIVGVGSTRLFGAEYAMRIWLDPHKLESYKLVPSDVTNAVKIQNVQISAGYIGYAPTANNQGFTATISAQSRLQTVDQFKNILLKVNTDGSLVHLSDVANVELGASSYSVDTFYNGTPTAALGVYLSTGANALNTAELVKEKMASLAKYFPDNLETVYPYDTTPFISISIKEVVKTLFEAVALVFIVMLIFLQNIRATLIPTITVPIVLLGTLAILLAMGYSINTLTMFAMVLAIGLLVDDAIVVVENVERIMQEDKLSPLEATRKSMREISSALIGIGVVLCTVFIPMAFFSGSTGVIYRQFSVTIVSAVALSVLVALILTPTLCIGLLRSNSVPSNKGLSGWFNTNFTRLTNGYVSTVDKMTQKTLRFIAIFIIITGGTYYVLNQLPSSFIPDEDQGVTMTLVQLPSGSTKEQTNKTLQEIQQYYKNNYGDSVESAMAISGFSFMGSGTNMGMMFIKLKNWDERTNQNQSAASIVHQAMIHFLQEGKASIYPVLPPAIQGLGNSSGFDFYLTDQTGISHNKFIEMRNMILGMAAQNPKLAGVRPNSQADTPQLKIEMDQLKAKALGVSLADANSLISTAFGGSYINDFIHDGNVKSVYAQGIADSRMTPQDLLTWKVRNNKGQMVSLSSFVSTHWFVGPASLTRYDGHSSLEIVGTPAPGVSTGEAMAEIEKIVDKLPIKLGVSWTGLSYQEIESSGQTGFLYGVSILMVFLCLAALYENWGVPIAVMLSIPLGVLGAAISSHFLGQNNNVYFQVGLLTTIGLGAKNAIMIVEFAKTFFDQGDKLLVSIIKAAKIRFRPILMTSIAFGMGVLPLAISNGAGSGAQNAVGIGVLGGVITSTTLGVLFVPVFFVFVMRLFGRSRLSHKHRDIHA